MIFNSIDFLLFFSIVYIIYLLSKHHIQNIFLLISSYFFYGYWDYRYLSLLLISTLVDYFVSLQIIKVQTTKVKKFFLIISILSNLSILGFFKYYNFFTLSAKVFLASLGFYINPILLEFALPLGISFYTFQTMSYTIDVYRGQITPTKNFFDFALYVSFFPQLVAGPIERATNLLPQVLNPRSITFQKLSEGSFLVLLGYFKKIYIADNLAFIVDPIFKNPNSSGAEMIFGCFVFFFQIYGDFAGYSDIARGIAKFMGFELMQNFNHPLFGINVSDFWRRWHISFMSWLRDYVYFSIGDKTDSESKKHFKNFLVFFLSGLWHGANWTFVIWGSINGIVFIFYRILQPYLPNWETNGLIWKEVLRKFILGSVTLFSVCLPLIYFRSTNVSLAWIHTQALWLNFGTIESKIFVKFLKNIVLLVFIEYIQNKSQNEFAIFSLPIWLRTIIYVSMFYSILILGNFDKNAFIYFVF
jgi:D-alanyl-lipoteichoic acid acyltransferase DltB (MBOAT superfamily)